MSYARKKRMAKYMIEDLLNIAKNQLIKIHPELDTKAAKQKVADEYAAKQKEILIRHYPQEDMKVLLKYKKAYTLQTISLVADKINASAQIEILVPHNYNWDVPKEYTNCEKEYVEKLAYEIGKVDKDLHQQIKPYVNLLRSVRYLEDVLKYWDNYEVEKYVREKSECITCTALTTLTEADTKLIKMNEKLLKEKDDESQTN